MSDLTDSFNSNLSEQTPTISKSIEAQPCNLRPTYPPRLQHSPSLPNLWSPQKSETGLRETGNRDRCSTRTAVTSSSPSATMAETQTRHGHVKYASIDPVAGKFLRMKTYPKWRTERDEPHSLLTPPLTPSSSIRTTASSAMTDTSPDQELNGDINEEILDLDTESTRILLLEHVSQDIDIPYLETTIPRLLTNAATDKTTRNDELPASVHQRDIVKGINMRLHRDVGSFPIVFFDVRLAKKVNDIINSKTFDGHLQECVANREAGNDSVEGVSARLITLEDLNKMLGHSKFLDGIEGAFSLRVQKLRYAEADNGPPEKTALEDNDAVSEAGSVTRAGMNISTVYNVLKAYGSIRSFAFIQEEVDHQGVASIVYRVEYHDSRDAELCMQQLDNQTFFSMRFTLSPIAGGKPDSAAAGDLMNGLPIFPAGIHSKIRQPFVCTVDEDSGNTREVATPDITSQTLPLPVNPPTGGGSSPTYFYTTTHFDPNALHLARHEQAPPAIHIRSPGYQDIEHASMSLAAPVSQEQHWERELTYRAECISPTYSHDGVCQYCPSRGVPHSVGYVPNSYPPFAFPPPPVTPPLYYPGHYAPPQAMLNAIPAPHNYEYIDSQMPLGLWYDPALAAPSPIINSGPFFVREEASCGHPGGQYPAAYMSPPTTLQQTQKLEAPERTVSLSKSAHRSSGSNQVHESNTQLNLDKIINGEEVRTTVMIKNIPNKMTDVDLTTYIAKVCPRRIDFLYLRMDFKNGCNVGYGFVNFIKVEDLLHFARERLGAKWNMFSSEKVLQMSYATYQGKEASIEKFKNSPIMDERESWRPRIFYSSGPQEGLPEPFPQPTHIGRKERSSFNRGTLFPPGINSHNIQSHGILQMSTNRGAAERCQSYTRRRQQDDDRESRRNDKASTFRTSNQRQRAAR